VAARCADNSETDCVIVAAGDTDSLGDGDGEGVGSAGIGLTQLNITSTQRILAEVVFRPCIDDFGGDSVYISLQSCDPFFGVKAYQVTPWRSPWDLILI
jgi:hypothetical protein